MALGTPEVYELSDRYFLVAVLERDPETRSLAVEALHREHAVALAVSGVGELRVAFDHIRPRAVLLDVEAPCEEELALVRALRANDLGGTLSIVVVGAVAEQELPVELCELVDAYVRKPADWARVARVVINLATGRRPPSTGVFVPRPA